MEENEIKDVLEKEAAKYQSRWTSADLKFNMNATPAYFDSDVAAIAYPQQKSIQKSSKNMGVMERIPTSDGYYVMIRIDEENMAPKSATLVKAIYGKRGLEVFNLKDKDLELKGARTDVCFVYLWEL